ncbi:hypothetical protein CGH28_20800 [Vibrio parahaemolyticus]|uniref:hypothetical protein n=1 Tax=Vibrio parahaemolyticus TaxID=670 RepID=UPI00070BD604|nr:hypothetical protein [Vibrio parahaemolyticus]ALM69500.1 hypothetical protein FORC4_p068 [Vibrio parahaemolyticus]ELB2105262.1 hypothetical protein [Vibrio parahaemolyticus]ELB2132063.1 hypothetical protein [Vibrio parahaemolyticus]ELB2146976.1 hypothetical protein [Vibrio parahaemolyticus]ELB2239366.1 hypothetical protein [Vibrio parahaemolyticus]
MKTFTLAVLGGLITSACWAAPSGQLNDDQLFITGIKAPLPSSPPELQQGYVDVGQVSAPQPQAVERGKMPLERVELRKVGPKVPTGAPTPQVLAPQTSSANVSTQSTSSGDTNKTASGATTFFVAAGEAPYRALQRWLDKAHITKVAYGLSDEQQAKLLEPIERNKNFTGSLAVSIHELGKALGIPLRFDVQRGIAAIHTLNTMPDVQWVHGASLKEAVANLAHVYGWQWHDDGQRPSWMSADDYPLMSEYGIVTPRGAFDLALDTVLEGYPVQAQLIPSSRSVFIREKE